MRNEISGVGEADVTAAFQQVENELEKMFLASAGHLLPSDIQISNRRQRELALNLSAAYYSAEWEELTGERRIVIFLFIQGWESWSGLGQRQKFGLKVS